MVEAWLGDPTNHCRAPERLAAAMRYSLTAGGKRIRPVLCLLSAAACGKKPAPDAVMPFAAAIECIHTYSLIHDDLPAMDDDDLRRGKPSCHKQFDEATAILAGDGLLSDAFLFMTRVASSGKSSGASSGSGQGISDGAVLLAIALAAEASGSAGMVGGQALDMEYTARNDISLEELAAMHALKTGAMLRMSCEAGAVLAEAGAEERHALAAYGTAIGAAFQIMDDILDVVGNEKDLGKPVG
ncbi:polyprenyl synthetase family protein, partial [Desulfovibrio sp. OttesenSCG-928-G15]|nr:polyprenyl synthetase family protein [Desulfovibrio sp. OttesenSCG-928-G15]